MADWYVRVDGEQYGPYTTEQLKTYAAEGHVTPQSEVRRGDGPWCAATKVKGMFPEGGVAAPPKPTGPPPKSVAPPPKSSSDAETDSTSPVSLANGEEVLYSASPAMFRNHPFAFILCLILCLLVIGIVFLLVWYFSCKGTQLTVTNKRTSLRTGILSKNINEVFHRDVRNVRLSQTFWQRVLGVGSLELSSAGQSDVEIAVAGIRDPEKVKSLINEYRD